MQRNKLVWILTIPAFCLFLVLEANSLRAEAIIADHQASADFDLVPDSIIQAIGESYLIFYGHTSHGSQIITGLNMVYEEDSLYDPSSFSEYGDDLGGAGDTTWVPPTREFLNNNPDYNMVMWSWCGGVSDNTEEGINIYLNAMNDLDQDYPDVKFIYMTGHLDGGGPSGNLYIRNNQIRAYCSANDKVLFDFADIESYDPDGNYYPDASDACEWCETWCSSHPCADCPGCAHSHCFNCYQKGKAWWWMMARISGWNPAPDSVPHVISTSPSQNQLDVPVNTNISVAFDIPMDQTTINDSTFVVNAWSTGLHQGTITYDSPTKTATLNPDNDFDVGEIVTVVLTTGIISSVGTPMESSYVWSFTAKVDDGAACFTLDSTTYTIGDSGSAIFAADLDNDGDIDLATATYSSDKVWILLNNGSGHFVISSSCTVGSYPESIFGADLDLDGDVDLANTNYSPSNSVSILENNGNGVFTRTDFPTGGASLRIFSADLDGDSDFDLVTVNAGNVSVLFNDGDGNFDSSVVILSGGSPNAVFAADLNGDRSIDLAVTNYAYRIVTILFNNGYGNFSDTTSYPLGGSFPLSVFGGDLDGDSCLDLAVTSSSGHVSILFNIAGSFPLDSVYTTGYNPRSIFAGDVDGDNDLDLVTAIQSSGDVSVLLNNGDGTFAEAVNFPTDTGIVAVTSADFNGDGDLDLAISNGLTTYISVLLNNLFRGDCNADEVVDIGDVVFLINYLFKNGPAPNPLSVGDVNCDGVVDVGDVVYLINYLFKNGPTPCCP